jgi:hypothetical protein
MKTMHQLRLIAVLPWWVQPYLWALAIACWAMGTQPDVDRLRRKLLRGVRFKITGID